MFNRSVAAIIVLLLLSWVASIHVVQPRKSDPAIYIRADGIIDPVTAPISTADNSTYVLTADIIDPIVVERDNIVLDGANHAVDCYGLGIDLTDRSNVTTRNIRISSRCAILLRHSNRSTIFGANITIYSWGVGIEIDSSNDNNITGNRLRLRGLDISQPCIYLSSSADNLVFGNEIVADVGTGIYLVESSNNRVFENNVTVGIGSCVELYDSRNNSMIGNILAGGQSMSLVQSCFSVLRDNRFIDCKYSLRVTGLNVTEFTNDVDNSNTVNGKPIYYWVNEHDRRVPYDAGCVILVNCSNIIVENLTLENNYSGVSLAYTDKSTISRNLAKNNYYGVLLWSSTENSIIDNDILNNEDGISQALSNLTNIVGNEVADSEYSGIVLEHSLNVNIEGNNITRSYFGVSLEYCSDIFLTENNIHKNHYGIFLVLSSNNRFFHNNFVDNVIQVGADYLLLANTWDDGYPSGGNYWSDYAGADSHSGLCQNETGFDWIGDLPYEIDQNNTDHYPLMQPFEVETENLRLAYRGLLLNLHEINSQLDLLSTTVRDLGGNVTGLQGKYDSLETTVHSLQEKIASLNSTVQSLEGSLDSTTAILNNAISNLQSQLSTANSTLHAYIEGLREQNNAMNNQLNNILNVLYVVTAIAVILVVVTIYLAARKLNIQKKSMQETEPNTEHIT